MSAKSFKDREFDTVTLRFVKRCLFFFLPILVICCSSNVRGVYHIVRSGETLKDISEYYNVSPEEISRINKISHQGPLKEGKILFIPRAKRPVTGRPRQKEPETTKKVMEKATDHISGPNEKEKSAALDNIALNKPQAPILKEKPVKVSPKSEKAKRETPGKIEFIWPLKGKVTSRYGVQPEGIIYNHIRITAQSDNSVYAAAPGRVIFSNFLKDFGGTIIIKHDDHYATVYTHLKHLKVRTGQRVKQGEIIGTASPSTKKGESFIHFEIRYNNKPQNPLSFLPG